MRHIFFLFGLAGIAVLLLTSTVNAAGVCPSVPGAGLRFGQRNPQVSLLQKCLGMTTVTGYFGPLTLSRLRAFQASHSISPTGYYGPLTFAVLSSSVASSGGSATGGSYNAQTDPCSGRCLATERCIALSAGGGNCVTIGGGSTGTTGNTPSPSPPAGTINNTTIIHGSYCDMPMVAYSEVCKSGAQYSPKPVSTCSDGSKVYLNELTGQYLHASGATCTRL